MIERQTKFQQIIALCGPAGCGKTTLADLLIENYHFIRLSFAAPVKRMIRTVLDMQGVSLMVQNRMLFGDLKETPTPFLSNNSPRYAMQTLGIEWCNLMDKHLWTDIWMQAAQFVPRIIVDDMHFIHEAEVVKTLGGKIIRIDRPRFGPGEHTSERDYLNINPDFTITNNVNSQTLLARLIETGVLS